MTFLDLCYEVCSMRIYRNMSIDAGSQERAAIIEALKRLTSMCSVEEDATLAHGQNQKILFNSGGYSH